MRKTTHEILMRRYLLGDLSQEERVRVEGDYLADPSVFEELLAAENDLIDAYVRGNLSRDETQKFEEVYVKSPKRRERVEFARALRQVYSSPQEPLLDEASPWRKVWAMLSMTPRMPQWALAAAAVVIVAFGSWLIVQNQRLRADLQQALAGQADLRRETDSLRENIAEFKQKAEEQTREARPRNDVASVAVPIKSVFSFRLGSGVVSRSPEAQENTLTVRPTVATLQLQLVLERDEYKTYEGVLMTAERKQVAREETLKSHMIRGEAEVDWRLPANNIPSGDYIIQLNGRTATGSLEDVASYSFRVLRQ